MTHDRFVEIMKESGFTNETTIERIYAARNDNKYHPPRKIPFDEDDSLQCEISLHIALSIMKPIYKARGEL